MDTEELIELVARIRSGQLQALAAYSELDRWIKSEKSVEANVIHFMYHYVADADIRKKDAGYQVAQELRLNKLMQSLGEKAR
jgi:hypothetical protein